MSSADCCCAMWQSPIQAAIRPAVWLPGIRNLHSKKETWIIPDATPEVCLENLVSAVALLGEREKMHIHKVRPNRNFVQIYSYTEFEWLDIVEIEFQPGQERGTLGKDLSKLEQAAADRKVSEILDQRAKTVLSDGLGLVDFALNLPNGQAHSFSTGVLPLMIPLAFLLNMVFFFVPFYDNNFNTMRLERIRCAMKLNIEIATDHP